MMLHTKYEGSRPCGFRQEDCFMVFPIQAYVKHVNPGASQFWPQGYNLNKLDRGSPDDATTRHRALIFGTNIKALCLVVSDKKIFSWFSLYKPL